MDELILKQLGIVDPSFPTKRVRTPEQEANFREAVKDTLEQIYPFSWGCIEVARRRDIVDIKWNLAVGNQQVYSVKGMMREISFIPDTNLIAGQVIVSTNGDGHVQLNLKEGRAYFFKFYFFNDNEWKRWESNGCKEDISNNDNLTKSVRFQVAIPFSEEKKALLERALTLESGPEKQIELQIEAFLKKQDTLGAMRKLGIERIKARKLSEDEEEDQIADLNDHLALLKKQLGL